MLLMSPIYIDHDKAEMAEGTLSPDFRDRLKYSTSYFNNHNKNCVYSKHLVLW